jgi:hypothetical protein
MDSNYVLVVAWGREASSNIASDKVTEEISYGSTQDVKNPPICLTGSNPTTRLTPISSD